MKLIIGFSKAKSSLKIGSKLIRWYLGTQYSHIYLNFHSDKIDRDIIYEAVGAGVRFIGKRQWEIHAVSTKEIQLDVSPESYKKLIQFCVDNSGLEYGSMQNIGVIIAKLFKLSKNPFKSGKNCSEIIMEELSILGYSTNICYDLITPKDIEEILEQSLLSK